MTIQTAPSISQLRNLPCPRDFGALVEVIEASGSLRRGVGFECLEWAIAQTDGFFAKLMPFLWKEALRADELLDDIPLLDEAGEVRLTQRQCLCVLANAFLCRFTERSSYHATSGPDMPSINFDGLFGGDHPDGAKAGKLRLIFGYFEACRERILAGNALGRKVRFLRYQAEDGLAADWRGCTLPLARPVMHGLHESIDGAKDMLRVDFANAIIGGGVISRGGVQEEIMFACCPELIVSRLFCPVMRVDEALAFVGTEQFSRSKGYGRGLRYGSPFVDPTPVGEDGILNSWIVAIDALAYGRHDSVEQFEASAVLRELRKAWAGFTLPDSPWRIATGNWGCGAFGGDLELKSVIQWLAASRARREMHYFPWDEESVHEEFPPLVDAMVERGVTVGEVSAWLFRGLREGSTYQQLRMEFLGTD